MKYLKQSTAAVIPFGPALLPSDGVTLVTSLVSALDHASTGIFVCKNGGAAAIRHATVTATTYDAYGSYLVTLDTTDTNTLGRLRVMFAAAASCLPIWEDFTVLPANVFDSIISGSANLKTDVDTIKTQAVTAAAGVTVPSSIASPTNITAATGIVLSGVTHTGAVLPRVTLTDTVTTYTGDTPQTGDAFARIGAAGAGLTALGDTRVANLDATISSRTKPADTQAAVTTVTNLTNAPTAGDLTATMKTSVTTAATAATPIAASVTGAVGSVAGAVGSVTADVGITQAAADKVFGGSGAAMAELAVVPGATPSPRSALMLIYMALRNKLTTTASVKSVYVDAGTALGAKALSDDGTTYTEGKMA